MKFTVSDELDGITVKHFLRKHCNVSARTLAKLKRVENGIMLSGQMIRSIDILHSGDILTITLPEDEPKIKPSEINVRAAYEDDCIIIFDKPAGMPVHPVHEYKDNTLANAAAYYMSLKGESYAFRPVSRLDKDTSGLVLCAKNRYAAAFLPENNMKIYHALCHGKITGSGTIDSPLRIKEGHTIQREAGKGGQRAVTHYRVLENYKDEYTLLEIWLETGRTHQIRAHFSSTGHPLAGDDMYGGSREIFPRQCLHCTRVTFTHPETREIITVQSEIDFFKEYAAGSTG